ncbi:M56 family metallopeptidase [Bombilactobacillus bombi]|uniref:M56 family metallopeptidase n=1 Tax=Bombilactobacillus bombi TaxID=1303590 RepID=UPI0015E605B8|nr:M56 family metallopeptidase [Bombilactobacillus bombi]MBA1435246.1 M56 family metallopeptidase [Bombilactobacillus bombi]
MHLSISSILISVIWCSLLVISLQIIISNKHNYKNFRIDFLIVISIIIILRLLLPFEFSNTYTISSYKILPVLYSWGFTRIIVFGKSITIFKLLEYLWIIGTILMILNLFYSIYKINRISKSFKKLPSSFLCSDAKSIIPNNIELYLCPISVSPFTTGLIHPKICLPNLSYSNEDQVYVIKHELCHIYSWDMLKKYIIEILVCFYWWLPPIYIFRKQVNTIIEMNVDYKIVKNKPKKVYAEYISSLINMSAAVKSKKISNNGFLRSNFTILEQDTLKQRILFMLDGHKFKSTPFSIKTILIILPVLLTSIIIEPNFYNRNNIKGTYGPESFDKSTYVLKKNGSYYLILKGKNIGRIIHYPNINNSKIKNLPLRSK